MKTSMPPLKITKKHHKHINNPFTSSPKSLPLIHGTLSFNPNLPQHQIFHIGEDFQLIWSTGDGGHLSISHQSHPQRSIWSTIPGEPFVSAASVQTEIEESRGSFAIKDGEVFAICNHQSVEEITLLYNHDIEREAKDHGLLSEFLEIGSKNDSFGFSKDTMFPILLITGWVFSKRKKAHNFISDDELWKRKKHRFGRVQKPSLAARYWVILDQKNNNQIGFQVKFGDFTRQRTPKALPRYKKGYRSLGWKLLRIRRRHFAYFSSSKEYLALSSEDDREVVQEEGKGRNFHEINRVMITISSERDEKFFGFGEQFSHVEFKGRRVPILVQEQGIGRGDQPISFAANLVSYRSAGDWSTTYAPSPFYMTSKMKSLYLEGYTYSIFDLTKPDRVQIQVHGCSVQGRILNGNSPVELIEHFTETIGRPPMLPDWIISGAVVGMQGGTDAVHRVWDQLQDYDVPVSAFWLQDWVGQRKTIIGSQLWWNWEVDTTHYAGWKQLVKDLRSRDIRVLTYCNPCLVPTDEKPNRRKDLFEEARSLGILVKNNNGATYMMPNTAFDVGMLDLTHPKAVSWFKNILHEMVANGVSGWMADFGEGLPVDANLFSGEDPVAAHNRYPELWAKVNREFVDELRSASYGKEHEDHEENPVFFMRAGFRNSPKWAMLFWEGDQMVSWQNHDGIKSSVTGLLSSGFCGFALNHSDIGGYCAVNLPIIKYQRDEELLMRWMELNAFTTIFRTHEGNKPSLNCQFYSSRNTLAHFSRFAKIYKAWKFYRIQLVKEASDKGLPVVRHLFLHYPDDEHIQSLTYQQFLVGTEILVVPVLDKGKKQVKAYFPVSGGCSWQHIWSGKIFSRSLNHLNDHKQEFETWIEAPIGYPAVFVKLGSSIGEAFLQNLKDLGIL